ncbi:uncharacterized protein BN800_02392 [Bacteroides sp. CAG:875]|nr:uncharacterized protein BN800_02392 [Bacteroides sp. CAG:875]
MIQDFADWLVYGLFGLSADTPVGVAVNFFFYDTIKILILLFFISVLMGIVNAYFPIERLRNYLVTHKMYGLQYLLASLFGAITPFCSCSSIPLFIGFVKGGIPLGVTFAFLITSPLVNEVAVAMFLGSFGLKVTLIYVISGILLGVIGGIVLGRMRLAPYLSDWVKQIQAHSSAQADEWEKNRTTFIKRLPTIVRDAWKIVSGVLIYILIGIGIGAFMHGFVPEGFFQQYMSKDNWYAVPLSVILAVPMCYACCADVCQCSRYRTGNRGICGKRYSHWNRNSFHDGGRRTFLAGSHPAEESNDLETDRHILRNGGVLHHSVGLSV